MNAFNLTRLSAAAAVVAATACLLAAPAQAQTTDDRPLTRAEVNQQTLAAMRAGEIVSGEGRPQGPEAYAVSTKSREERKAETLQARRKGELPVGGEGTYKSSLSQQKATAHSTKTRAERKAETMQAIREHKTMQPGEFA